VGLSGAERAILSLLWFCSHFLLVFVLMNFFLAVIGFVFEEVGAVLLCCCAAVLLCCCAAVLLCCCAAVLLCCCAAVLLCCCAAVLLCCCAAVLFEEAGGCAAAPADRHCCSHAHGCALAAAAGH
jgi:hypothetical protein